MESLSKFWYFSKNHLLLRASAIDTDVTVTVRTPRPLNREKLRTKVEEGAARSAANFLRTEG